MKMKRKKNEDNNEELNATTRHHIDIQKAKMSTLNLLQ